MNWFMANKGPLGSVFAALSAGFLASRNEFLEPWGLGFGAFGAALMGAGFMKSDDYYKDKSEIKQ